MASFWRRLRGGRSPIFDSIGRSGVAEADAGEAMLSESDVWAMQVKFIFASFMALTLVGCFLTQP